MRFDELMLQDPEGELRIRFHPQLTVLSGLSALDRRALADGILDSLTGGPEPSTLRYVDAVGRPITVRNEDDQLTAHHADGEPAPSPLGTSSPEVLRSLMLVGPDDLGGAERRVREDEPPELREARDMLEDLTAELRAAVGQQQAVGLIQERLDALDSQLRVARDGLARREYAQVLAHLERVRAEAAAVQSGASGIEADRHLLANVDIARELAERWQAASIRLHHLARELEGEERLEPDERDRVAEIPSEPPGDLAALVDALVRASDARDALDQRLQILAVSKLPAPSVAVVADLGLLDPATLWPAAERTLEAGAAMQQVRLSLGGLELDEMGPPPAVIEEIESAHSAVEEAERAAHAAKVPGMAATGLGVTAGVIGLAAAPVLLPMGLVGAAVAAGAGIVRPRARRAKAVRAERAALGRADATSYLAFHIRRVEASVDPNLREGVEAAMQEQRAALIAWEELVGPEVEVETAIALRDEVQRYHEALRNLGDTADEIEELRREVEEDAEPTFQAALDRVVEACAPYLLDVADVDHLAGLRDAVARQCQRGVTARAQVEIDDAEVDEQQASARLDELLLQLGFDAGPLDARVGALEWAVSRADEREESRERARPPIEIDAELRKLEAIAAQLRRPEWDRVTAADAAAPDISELEAQRSELFAQLNAARAEVDVERLADRHAAVERRVAALEGRRGQEVGGGDPGAVAEIQQHLLARLTEASHAGPDSDPVPVVLDEAFLRAPADRKWDLLDLLARLAEKQQVIYLSEDGFVAAWARQRALEGAITLLELAPEPA